MSYHAMLVTTATLLVVATKLNWDSMEKLDGFCKLNWDSMGKLEGFCKLNWDILKLNRGNTGISKHNNGLTALKCNFRIKPRALIS